MGEATTELLEEINWTIVAPLIFIQIVLLTVALIDWLKAEETNGPRWLWAIIIIGGNIVGPILYFIFGRRDQ